VREDLLNHRLFKDGATNFRMPGLPVRNRAKKLTVGARTLSAKGCFPLRS
jgi:hypothetical protein